MSRVILVEPEPEQESLNDAAPAPTALIISFTIHIFNNLNHIEFRVKQASYQMLTCACFNIFSSLYTASEPEPQKKFYPRAGAA
jgi:hypothetical protein